MTTNKLKRKVTAEDLMGIQRSYTGSNYSEVTHAEVITKIKDVLRENNLVIESERYLSGANGQVAIGIFGIAYPDTEMRYMIGFANSMNGQLALKLFNGSEIRACQNGNIFVEKGVNFYKKRHVGESHDEIMQQIEPLIKNMDVTMKRDIFIKDAFKSIVVSDIEAARMAGEMYILHDLVTPTQFSLLKRELLKPTIVYGELGTLWQFYNNFTYSVRSTTPLDWYKVHSGIAEFLTNEYNISAPKEEGLSGVDFTDSDSLAKSLDVNPDEVEHILDGDDVREV